MWLWHTQHIHGDIDTDTPYRLTRSCGDRFSRWWLQLDHKEGILISVASLWLQLDHNWQGRNPYLCSFFVTSTWPQKGNLISVASLWLQLNHKELVIQNFLITSNPLLLTDFVCFYNYEFWFSLCKIVQSSVILLLPVTSKSR